jgi:hypothetical protein
LILNTRLDEPPQYSTSKYWFGQHVLHVHKFYNQYNEHTNDFNAGLHHIEPYHCHLTNYQLEGTAPSAH